MPAEPPTGFTQRRRASYRTDRFALRARNDLFRVDKRQRRGPTLDRAVACLDIKHVAGIGEFDRHPDMADVPLQTRRPNLPHAVGARRPARGSLLWTTWTTSTVHPQKGSTLHADRGQCSTPIDNHTTPPAESPCSVNLPARASASLTAASPYCRIINRAERQTSILGVMAAGRFRSTLRGSGCA